ncbi:MAG: hypothetical protein GXY96_02720 [Tissierellia bacterium]|nr:hypothetical protein [Tissierellia bacterium]
MLVTAILFLILGLYLILSERYIIVKVESGRNIVEKPMDKDTPFFRYKVLLGVFSITLGIFSIINYIIF